MRAWLERATARAVDLSGAADDEEAIYRGMQRGEIDLDEIGRLGVAAADRRLDAWGAIDTMLRAAADHLRQIDPGQQPYAARRSIVSAFRARGGPCAPFTLKPEPMLTPPAGAPPCPPPDPALAHFFAAPGQYWADPKYIALLALPPEALPDGAMLPLCALGRVSTHALSRGDDYGEPVQTLYRRYGMRLSPAAVEYLSHPARHGWDAVIRPNVTHTRWFAPSAGWLLETAGEWPGAAAAPLFRLALEAGWSYVGRFLPERDWSTALLAEFADSPYGAPDSPRWHA